VNPQLPRDELAAVSERPEGLRLTLPRRTLPPVLRSAAWVLVGMAAALLLHATEFFLTEVSSAEASLELLLALPGLVIGVLILFSRTIIDLPPGRLVLRERAGPLVIKRSYDLNDLGPLTVEVLPLRSGAQPVPAGGPIPTEGVTILAAAVRGKGRRVLVFGYGERTLTHVACQVRLRGGWSRPAAPSPADLQ
jgi:hypothetical protein